MSFRSDLRLHEEILLLALKDDEGTIGAGTMYSYAVGGAILAELLLERRIGVVDGKKDRKLIDVLDTTPIGEPVLDIALQKLRDAKRRAGPGTWVQRFAGIGELKHRVAQGLCDRGILRCDQDKVLLIFSRRIYPEVDPAPERRIVERLERAIFTDEPEVEPRTAILVSLASSAGVLKVVFDKRRLSERKHRIDLISSGEIVGEATAEAIRDVQVALMLTTSVPLFIATTR